jgi:hypothetical protein
MLTFDTLLLQTRQGIIHVLLADLVKIILVKWREGLVNVSKTLILSLYLPIVPSLHLSSNI